VWHEGEEAAVDDGDWDTCLIASLLAVEKMVFCELVLNGFRIGAGELSIFSAAQSARTIGPFLHEIGSLRRRIPSAETAAQGVEVVARASEELLKMIPIDVPPMRTPEGFFPAIRAASSLERLRTALGFGPFEFEWWGNLP
jgi:hypothetical protein